MENTNQKAVALGTLLMAMTPFESLHGGNQALQKLLGASLYTKKGSRWFINTPKLNEKTIPELQALTDKVNRYLLKRGK